MIFLTPASPYHMRYTFPRRKIEKEMETRNQMKPHSRKERKKRVQYPGLSDIQRFIYFIMDDSESVFVAHLRYPWQVGSKCSEK